MRGKRTAWQKDRPRGGTCASQSTHVHGKRTVPVAAKEINRMNNYMMTIEYDGSSYKGWQILSNTDNTIQGKLSDVLSRLAGTKIDVIGSGRTDAGVHAKGQVANFHMNPPDNMDEDMILSYLNRYLPDDIAVTKIQKVDDRFHARFSARQKTYLYRIHVNAIPNVFEKRYVYKYLDSELNLDLMREAAKKLVGTHDFMAFCSNKHMKKSSVRSIYDIRLETVYKEDKLSEIDIYYTGNGFLQNMVRILTGTLIEIGRGDKSVDDIEAIIESRCRENAGFTAPAQGLMLMEVQY